MGIDLARMNVNELARHVTVLPQGSEYENHSTLNNVAVTSAEVGCLSTHTVTEQMGARLFWDTLDIRIQGMHIMYVYTTLSFDMQVSHGKNITSMASTVKSTFPITASILCRFIACCVMGNGGTSK